MTALNEISTKVLSSFIKKRKEQLNAKPGKGRPSKEAVAKKQKMQSGVKKAEEKRTAIGNAEYEQHKKNNNEVVDHVKKEIPGVLKEHGYSHSVGNEKHDIYSKSHPEGIITHMIVHKSGHKAGHTLMTGKSTTGWQGSGDTLNHHDFGGFDSYKKSVDQRKAEVPAILKNHIEKYESYHKARALDESVQPTDHSDKLFAIVENAIDEKPLEVSSYVDFMLKAKAIKEIEKIKEDVSRKIFGPDSEEDLTDPDEEDATNPDE